MATRIASVSTLSLLPRGLPAVDPGRAAALLGWVLSGVLLCVVAFGPGPGASQPPPVPAPAVPFVSQGLAVTRTSVELFDHPARGAALASLAPGTRLHVGGFVDVPAGLFRRRVLWVAVHDADRSWYGFVPADATVLSAGAPPRLDLSAVSVEQLLAPTDGPLGARGPIPGAEAHLAGVAGAPSSGITVPWLPDTITRWAGPITGAARAHGVDPNLVAIVMLVESGGNPRAVSPSGAVGLMQVMPATGADIATRRGIGGYRAEDLQQPELNIDFGTWYIAEMLKTFGRADDPDWQQSVELAAAAYNGGPGALQRALRSGGTLAGESVRYRRWVGAMWSERHGATSAGLDSWLAAGGARLVEAARGAAGA